MIDDKKLIQRVELLLNEKLADLEMLRIVMEKFFLRMAMAGNPDGGAHVRSQCQIWGGRCSGNRIPRDSA